MKEGVMEVISLIPISYPVDPAILWMGVDRLLISSHHLTLQAAHPQAGPYAISPMPHIRDSFFDLRNWPVIKCCSPRQHDTWT